MAKNNVDTVDFAFICARYDLDALPDAAISFPDMGDKQGLEFWNALTAQSTQLINSYPELTDYICTLYSQLWDLWTLRRGY